MESTRNSYKNNSCNDGNANVPFTVSWSRTTPSLSIAGQHPRKKPPLRIHNDQQLYHQAVRCTLALYIDGWTVRPAYSILMLCLIMIWLPSYLFRIFGGSPSIHYTQQWMISDRNLLVRTNIADEYQWKALDCNARLKPAAASYSVICYTRSVE